jgi:hypothetical protein
MRKQTESTLDSWLAELHAATTGGDGLTVREIAAKLGKSTKTVCEKILQPAKVAGRLVVGKKWQENISGARVQVPAYRVKGK